MAPIPKTVSQLQIEALLNFLQEHSDLARGLLRGADARVRAKRLWEEITISLNSIGTCKKSIEQWQKVWTDRKHLAKKAAAAARRSSISTGIPEAQSLSQFELQILNILGHGFEDEKKPSKPRKVSTQDNFVKVKRCCVKLVKEFSASVLELEAFQIILKLIPMSSEEREQLTTEAVLRLVEEDKEDTYEMAEETLDQEDDQSFSEQLNDSSKVVMVKTEFETTDCTCGKDVTNPYHEDDCPAKQNYFNFFDANVDTATCNICQQAIKWNNTDDLKEHLKTKHPDLTLHLEDEDIRSKSVVSSREDIEEIFLEDNEPEPPERKRKRIDQEVRYEEVEVDNDLNYQNLDKFGQYVASLLAHIPKKRSLRLQMRIVQKLIEEQAAAG